jgi:hypothetical protein
MLSLLKKRPDKSNTAKTNAWHVNFRNFAELPDTRVVRTAFFFNMGAVLVSCALILTAVYQEYRLYHLKAEIADWQAQIDIDKPHSDQAIAQYKKFRLQEQKVIELDAYLKQDQLVLSDFLIRLGETLPRGIMLTNVDSKDALVTLRGDVRGEPELASGIASAYEKQLREDKSISLVFESVSLTTLSRDSASGQLTFVIVMKTRAAQKK